MGFWDSIKDAASDIAGDIRSAADGSPEEPAVKQGADGQSAVEPPGPMKKKVLNAGAEKLLSMSRSIALRVVKNYHPGLHLNFIYEKSVIEKIVDAFESGLSNLDQREVMIVASNNPETVHHARRLLDAYIEDIAGEMSELEEDDERGSESYSHLEALYEDAIDGALGRLVKVTELIQQGDHDAVDSLLETDEEHVLGALACHRPLLELYLSEVESGKEEPCLDTFRLIHACVDPSMKMSPKTVEKHALPDSALRDVVTLFQ